MNCWVKREKDGWKSTYRTDNKAGEKKEGLVVVVVVIVVFCPKKIFGANLIKNQSKEKRSKKIEP